MRSAAIAVSFLAPLALAPSLLFYYDVTPKILLLCAITALALVLAAFHLDSLRAFAGTAQGRGFVWAALALGAVTLASAAISDDSSLAWNGSNWRRLGAIAQCAILLGAILLAAGSRGREVDTISILRAICLAGTIAALYGIAQYFGWDPLLVASRYEAGDGPFRIVRPPGPMGHSDYFSAYILWPVFAGAAIAGAKEGPWLGWLSASCGVLAIILSGSRGALAGLGLGALVCFAFIRPTLRTWGVLAAAALVLVGFYFSPLGTRLRARAHWIGEEPAGGARFLLWRDSVRMAVSRPLLGFGPDTFVAQFPPYESKELSRDFPDFFHESPHNFLLDTVTSIGVLGLVAVLALLGIAIRAGLRARETRLQLAGPLLGALTAAVVAHQFAVLTSVNAFFLYFGCAWLVSLDARQIAPRAWTSLNWSVLAAGSIAAGLLLIFAGRMTAADLALGSAVKALDAQDISVAALKYRRATELESSGVTADLYFSLRWAHLAADSQNAFTKLYLGQLAAGAANLAIQQPEGRHNAWLHWAELSASRNDSAAVESGLRSAISASPKWFKPHWALARLLFLEGKQQEAREEAKLAIDLNRKDSEVASSLGIILSSAGAPR
jgi:hypothetical protein